MKRSEAPSNGLRLDAALVCAGLDLEETSIAPAATRSGVERRWSGVR